MHLWFLQPCTYFFLCVQIYYEGMWEGVGPLEIETFLGPLKWHRAIKRMPVWAKKSLLLKYKKVEGRSRPTQRQQQCQIPPRHRSGFLTLLVQHHVVHFTFLNFSRPTVFTTMQAVRPKTWHRKFCLDHENVFTSLILTYSKVSTNYPHPAILPLAEPLLSLLRPSIKNMLHVEYCFL